MKKTVLLFGFGSEEAAAAKRAILPIGAAVRAVPDEEQSRTLGSLLGLAEDEIRNGTPSVEGKMLLMAGFIGNDTDRLLAAMRKAGFQRDVLKAVATPTNIGWTPGELWNEIHREHLTMSGR